MRHLIRLALAAMLGSAFAAHAVSPPTELVIGHLHAGSGPLSDASMAVDSGLRVWVAAMNSEGGVFVKPYGKRLPIRLIDLDDHGSPNETASLTEQLIKQDKVDVLVGDAGSELTAAEAPVALANKTLLFDPDGTGAKLFSAENPYIVLCGMPGSATWAKPLADFLDKSAAAAGIDKIALIYSKNDIDEPRADALRAAIGTSKAKLQIVYDKAVAADTTSYAPLLADAIVAKANAVIELGSFANDAAFIQDVRKPGAADYRMVFALSPGLRTEDLTKRIGQAALENLFTSVSAADINYKPDFGLSLSELRGAWARLPDNRIEFGWQGIAGYTAGLIVQEGLATTDSMAQLDLRRAVFAQSGKLQTVDGPFALSNVGKQTGEALPVGQLVANGDGGLVLQVVYPPEAANAVPVFGKG